MSEIKSSDDLDPGGRRRRADAERSVAVILDAAARVLGQRPQASIEDIAAAAGVTRQTVYAHFASRDTLVTAVVDHVTEEGLAAFDDAGLDELPPPQAVIRFLTTGWQTVERYPRLWEAIPPATSEVDRERHQPILERLERLVRRGQRRGDFDRRLPTSWLTATIVALAHAAGEETGAGRMEAEAATRALRLSVLRVLGVRDPASRS